MRNFRYIFPNVLTLFNLISGCIAIIIVFRGGNEYFASWMIFLAALFDLLDGMVARALNAKSAFGAQLDSLADVVSFGVAPSIILFNWLTIILTDISVNSDFEFISANFWQSIILLLSLLYVAGGAVRLARFNSTEQKSQNFQGLPIPAAALIVASLWLILGTSETELAHILLLNIYVVLAIIIILVFLMVSNIEMLSLKFKGIGFRDNIYQYILLAAGALLFIIFGVVGFFYAMLLYIILSLGKRIGAK